MEDQQPLLSNEAGREIARSRCPTCLWPSFSLPAADVVDTFKKQVLMCFFLGLSLKDMVADGMVFGDMYFDMEWPVLAWCLAASVVLPQVMTWCFLMSASMSDWMGLAIVSVIPAVGGAAYAGLSLYQQPVWMQKIALGLICCSAIPIYNFSRGIKAGKPPLSSGATWWEVAEGLIEAPFSGVLTLYGALLTHQAPSPTFALSVVFSCLSTSVAAHKLNTVGENVSMCDLAIGTLKQLPDVAFRILFLATMAFLTRPFGNGSDDELRSNQCYVAIAFVVSELAANSLLLVMQTKMGPAVNCLFSFAMLIGHPPESLAALGSMQNFHRLFRLVNSSFVAVFIVVLQTSVRELNPSDDRLEMLWTNYWPMLIVMLTCYLGVLCRGAHGLLALLKLKNSAQQGTEVSTKWMKLRRFQAAMNSEDTIMAGLLVTVDEIELPTVKQGDHEVPVAVVQGFCVSDQMGAAVMQQNRVADETMQKCFAVNPSFTLVTDVDGSTETHNDKKDVAKSFKEWKKAGGKHCISDHCLKTDNVLLTQLLISEKTVKCLTVDLVNIQLALDVRGTFSNFCVQDLQAIGKLRDWSKLRQDFIQWMRLCEVKCFTCPTSDAMVAFLPEISKCGDISEPFPNLESIILSPGREIDDDAMGKLCDIIIKKWNVLTSVSFYVRRDSSNAVLVKLSEAIRSALESTTIKLSLQGQDDGEMEAIVAALQGQSILPSLAMTANIDDAKFVLLDEVIKHGPGVQSISLDFGGFERPIINGCFITGPSPAGLKYFSDAIRHTPALQNISLDCREMSDDGMKDFNDAIQHARSLQNISLDCAEQISDDGMKSFSEAIRHAPALQNISFSFHRQISGDGMQSFSDAIRFAPALQNISLDCQGISGDRMKSFSDAIRHAPALQNISLSCVEILEDGMQYFSEAIRHAPGLQNISFASCVATSDDGMQCFSEAIRHAPALQNISLNCEEQMSDNVMKSFSEAIRLAPWLQNISLRLCHQWEGANFDIFSKVGGDNSGSALQHLAKTIRLAPESQTIDLSYVGQDDSVIDSVVAAIRQCSSLQHLSISGEMELLLLSETIRHAPALQNISLTCGTQMSDDGMKSFSDAIRHAPALQNISLTCGKISDNGMQYFSDAIRHAPALQNIRLDCGGLSDDIMKYFSDAMRHAPALQNISFASSREISDAGMQSFSDVIRYAPALQNISLDCWQMSDDVMKSFSDAIRHAPALQNISLNCGEISDDGMQSFSEVIRHALASQNISLQCFEMSDDVMKSFSDAIRHAPALQNISFSCQEMSDDGLKSFSDAIRHAPALQSISLILGFEMLDDGLKSFSDAIRHAPALQNISLNCPQMSDDVMKSFSDAIRHAPALHNISLNCPQMSDDVIKSFSDAIRHAPALQNIRLDCRGISDDGLKLLSEAIRLTQALQSVKLPGVEEGLEFFDGLVNVSFEA